MDRLLWYQYRMDYVNPLMNHVADMKNTLSSGNCLSDNKSNMFNMAPQKVFTHRFDFEVGYLIKSPCRECRNDSRLPGCADDCVVLEKIQTNLAESISCTNRT